MSLLRRFEVSYCVRTEVFVSDVWARQTPARLGLGLESKVVEIPALRWWPGLDLILVG